jgi:hypothetical protein
MTTPSEEQSLLHATAFEAHLIGGAPAVTRKARTLLEIAYKEYNNTFDDLDTSGENGKCGWLSMALITLLATVVALAEGVFFSWLASINTLIYIVFLDMVVVVFGYRYFRLRHLLATLPGRRVVPNPIVPHVEALLDTPSDQAKDDALLYYAYGWDDWVTWTLSRHRHALAGLNGAYDHLVNEQAQRFASLESDQQARAVALAALKMALYPDA